MLFNINEQRQGKIFQKPMDYALEYRRYRFILGFERFPEYLSYMKEQFPNLDLHHILGSVRGGKFTDALIYPISHYFHLYEVEAKKPYYFSVYLDSSAKYFIRWLEHRKVFNAIELMDYPDIEPETLKRLIQDSHRRLND